MCTIRNKKRGQFFRKVQLVAIGEDLGEILLDEKQQRKGRIPARHIFSCLVSVSDFLLQIASVLDQLFVDTV